MVGWCFRGRAGSMHRTLSGAVMDATELCARYAGGERVFRGEILRDLKLGSADLSDIDLHAADLSRADLSGARLTGADLSKAVLFAARLEGAQLIEAHIAGADLR